MARSATRNLQRNIFAPLPDLEREEKVLAGEREERLSRVRQRRESVNSPDWKGLTLAEKRPYVREALVCVLVNVAKLACATSAQHDLSW